MGQQPDSDDGRHLHQRENGSCYPAEPGRGRHQHRDLATEFAGLQDGTYDLGICGSTATNYPLWMEGYYDYRNATYCQITDPTFAEYQEEIAAALDESIRKDLVNEYQQFWYDEMPLVMLYHAYSFSVVSPRMSGVHQSDSGMLNEAVWNWEVTE